MFPLQELSALGDENLKLMDMLQAKTVSFGRKG